MLLHTMLKSRLFIDQFLYFKIIIFKRYVTFVKIEENMLKIFIMMGYSQINEKYCQVLQRSSNRFDLHDAFNIIQDFYDIIQEFLNLDKVYFNSTLIF